MDSESKQSPQLFKFSAYDPERCARVEGVWWSTSTLNTRFWLENRGYTDIGVEPASGALSDLTVEGTALALFFRQMAVMFRSGVPLPAAIRLSAYGSDRRMVGVCFMLEDRIREGFALSNAMRLFPRVFDPVTVSLIGAAEDSGRLSQVLESLAESQERRMELIRAVRSAMAYPLVLIGSTMILMLFFILVIAPMNDELFSSMGIELPLFNRMLIVAAAVMSSPWFPVLLLIFGGLGFATLRQPQNLRAIRHFLRRALLKVPPLRTLIQKASAVRMLEILSLLLDSGGSVDQALRFMIEASDEPSQRKLFVELRQKIIHGLDFAQALEESGFFPPLVTSLLIVGHETGRLEPLARRGLDFCEEDVKLALDTATKALEPILLAGAGVLAGFVVISTAAPMLQLIQSL